MPAGSKVIVEFENEDRAPHNVAFYTTPSKITSICEGEIITGPSKISCTFTAPSPPGTTSSGARSTPPCRDSSS